MTTQMEYLKEKIGKYVQVVIGEQAISGKILSVGDDYLAIAGKEGKEIVLRRDMIALCVLSDEEPVEPQLAIADAQAMRGSRRAR